MIDPYEFITVLTKKLDEDAIVVAANGTACVTLFQAGIVKKGQRYIWNSGCAAMGYALPASIGAHFASAKPIICIEGDGSLMMNVQELQTVKHYNLPIKLFLLNNKGYHSLKETQDNFFDGQYTGCTEKDISFPDFQKLAELYDFKYWKLENLDQDQSFINGILSHPGRCFCEVVLGEYKFKKQGL